MQHFDVAVIGSGSGNTIIDEQFDHLKVALIEQDAIFGGTCLNRGCIPTKMFVVPAEVSAQAAEGRKLGIDFTVDQIRWRDMRDRIFGRIDPISEGGRKWRESNSNVTLLTGAAQFVDPHTIDVGGQRITADQIVIATGSRPRPLDIEVSEDIAERIHTSDSIMRIDELPERLVIIGAGFIAMEFAHIFSALGVDVTIVHRSERVLRGHDDDIADSFLASLSERVKVRLNQSVVSIEPGPADDLSIETRDRNGVDYLYLTDMVLVATGRLRNGDRLNLDAAGVEATKDWQIRVDATQRTSQPHIWALGDASSDYLLKHVANAEARTVQHNLLNPDDIRRTDHRYVPHAVFSHPQIAAVGATEAQLQDWGTPYVVARQKYADVAYGWALEDEDNFVKLLADPRNWRLLGAHIVGPQASTLIQPLVQAMSFGLSVKELARGQYWIHPALTEVLENALLALPDAWKPGEIEA